MARAVIRLGDDTSHGGKVITASARMTIDGIPVALWGDRCSCPIDGHDTCVICEGEPEAIYDGRPVALEGHKTDCGAVLIASQHNRCHVVPLVKHAAGVAGAALTTTTTSEARLRYDEQVRIIDGDGQPLSGVPYFIEDTDGKSYQGLTDEEGCCERVHTRSAQKLEVLVGVPALEKWGRS